MQISDRLHLLKIPFLVPISPELQLERFVNLFLIYGEKEILLVDSGVAGAEATLFAYLAATGRRPEEIRRLILTHSHPDHLGGAAAIQRRSGCEVAAHPAERNWIEDVARQAAERPVPGFNQLVGGPVRVDRLLADGERIGLDKFFLEVVHTPGHSPGSISLHLPGERVLISGDAVPLPGDLPIFTDWSASLASLARMREISGVEVLLSSWDRPRSGEEVKLALAAGRDWLERIRCCVGEQAEKVDSSDPLELCRGVVASLGLPPAAVNHLVAKSFASCLSNQK
ncbi:MAG TPA: MBL fold metallo-hydrolase [Desulfurivibrionaceae bacterium]|nr:MBL fold metallo-hydrolase [Desulfurivibrionaceae bacterium]